MPNLGWDQHWIISREMAQRARVTTESVYPVILYGDPVMDCGTAVGREDILILKPVVGGLTAPCRYSLNSHPDCDDMTINPSAYGLLKIRFSGGVDITLFSYSSLSAILWFGIDVCVSFGNAD
jgi:hypothetical protein